MKLLVLNYSFDASAKQITFTDYNPVIIERLTTIVNVTDGIVIYNCTNPAKLGTVSTNVLTLAYDTVSMSDTDDLMIVYDDSATTQPVSGTVTANLSATDNAVLDTIDSVLDTINAKFVTGTVIGDVNLGATDNAVLDAAVTALQLIDNAVDGNYLNVNMNLAGTDAPSGNGTAATSLRVSIASDSTGQIKLAAGTAEIGKLAAGTAEIGFVKHASGSVASGAIASGAIASGAIASGAFASGSIATGAIVDMLADDSAITLGTSRVMPIGCVADETSSDSVDEGDVGIPRMTLDRKLLVTERPSATGESLDIFSSIDLDETEEDIKATAGKIYGYYIYNNHTATLYVRFYNATAANTTVGTTAAILVIPIPSGAAANCSFPGGIGFSTALCAAATTGVAANDTGAPAANAIVINVFYK